MDRKQLIQTAFSLLYDATPRDVWSSYAIKHEIEEMILPLPDRFYITNSEVIQALVELGVSHEMVGMNARFKVKEKFDIFRMNRKNHPTEKPRGVTTKKWDAYLHALKTMDALVADLIKDDTTEDINCIKLARKVGHHA